MKSRLTSPYAAAAVLAAFWGLLVAAAWNKSVTNDEIVHAAAGYSYWKFNDYRIDPENGNLPQRIAGLPLLSLPFPPPTSENWRIPSQWKLGDEWFHATGVDVPRLLRAGRASAALQAVALAWLVWAISRRIFGPVGGMVSLLACVLNPTIIANGSLMTSDVAAALFFLAASWGWWRLLERITVLRLILGGLATAGLFVSKSSAALIFPIFLTLAALRLFNREALPVVIPGYRGDIATRRRRAVAMACAAAFQAVVCYVVVWGFYGFRYSAFAPDQPSAAGSSSLWTGVLGQPSLGDVIEKVGLPRASVARARDVLVERSVPLYGWSRESDNAVAQLQEEGLLAASQVAEIVRLRTQEFGGGMTSTVKFLARHRVLPEAFLVGTLHAWRFAQMRAAFLDGEYYLVGKPWFFPYTFAVKTPLAFIGLLVLAAWAWRRRELREPAGWSTRAAWHLAPLAAVFVFYGWALLVSRLNIGHRHMLALYPPLFVFAGSAGAWIAAVRAPLAVSRLVRGIGIAATLLVAAQGAEIAYRFPHFLAYFNGVISPDRAYRHFIDSSLDWGQDLPGVKAYIDAHPEGKPYYLAFFGNGDPRGYGIDAVFLPSTPGNFRTGDVPAIFEPVSAVTPPPEEIEALKRRHPRHDFLGLHTQEGRRVAVFFRPVRAWKLESGTYLISASSIQAKYVERDEEVYQTLQRVARSYLAPASAADAAVVRQYSIDQWREILNAYETIRQQRLQAFLRQYTPDAQIGHSVLVFKVSEADLARALDGPSPAGAGYLGRTLRAP